MEKVRRVLVKSSRSLALLPSLALWLGFSPPALGEATLPLTLENVPPATKIRGDEPFREAFSAKQSARYLDHAALAWQKRRNCVTCHTNMPYLMARPALASVERDSGEVRRFFEAYLKQRQEDSSLKPYEPVVVGAALAFNDAQVSGALAEVTREALDRMWTTQREDGGWDWPKCGWAPMEVDDHFGVTLAALAVGVAPGNYQETEQARGGLERVRGFLRTHESPSLHHRIMVAWASLRVKGLMEEAARRQVLEEVFSRQLAEGGWSTPGLLADWQDYKRKDGQPHTPGVADAYGTGLALIFSREMGIAPDDPRLKEGIAWLKRHQRASGKWFTRSPAEDSKHYISNTGTAYAVLALQACGELPGWPFGRGVQSRD